METEFEKVSLVASPGQSASLQASHETSTLATAMTRLRERAGKSLISDNYNPAVATIRNQQLNWGSATMFWTQTEGVQSMVTDRQVRRLMSLLHSGQSLLVCADKVGMDPETARKYRLSGKLPSEMATERFWRTRNNPFAEVWPWVAEQLVV